MLSALNITKIRRVVFGFFERCESFVKLTLMHRDCEVLAFGLDLATGAVDDIRPLERADLAPLGVFSRGVDPEYALMSFMLRRSIRPSRADYLQILEALKVESALELSVRSSGFTLSDQYWYRSAGSDATWAGSNFFENEWDLAFGEAILARDYKALARADTCVPDVSCGGAARKAWVLGADGPRLLKASLNEGAGEVYGEVAGSRMLARILPEGEYVPYELVMRGGEAYSSCPVIVGPAEDLMMPPFDGGEETEPAPEQKTLFPNLTVGRGYGSMLELLGARGDGQATAKMGVVQTLLQRGDFHPGNFGIVRNADTGDVRLAPFFDLAGSFGTGSGEELQIIRKDPTTAMLFVAAAFSDLDPSWDYSWYDPTALVGFGEELEALFSACDDLGPSYPALARKLFECQLSYVNSIKNESLGGLGAC